MLALCAEHVPTALICRVFTWCQHVGDLTVGGGQDDGKLVVGTTSNTGLDGLGLRVLPLVSVEADHSGWGAVWHVSLAQRSFPFV